VAVVTLGLGISACAAAVAIERALVYDPARTANFTDVYEARMTTKPGVGASAVDFDSLRDLSSRSIPSVTQIAGLRDVGLVARTRDRAEMLPAEVVSGSFAEVFRLRPQIGRWLAPGDDSLDERVVILSDRLWRDWFGADPAVIDHATIDLSVQAYSTAAGETSRKVRTATFSVIGVAARGFRGVSSSADNDLWLPSRAFAALASDIGAAEAGWVQTAVVRATPGADPKRLTDTLAAVAAPLNVRVVPAATRFRVSSASTASLAILSLAAIVLLGACANLANMLYARGAARASEVAVRLSLGASRAQVFRLFVIESALVSGGAAAIGLAIAAGALRLFSSAFPALVSRTLHRVSIDVAPDARVFLTALGAGVVAALVVGLATARRATRVPPNRALVGASAVGPAASGRAIRLALVAVQVTAAVLLTIVASLYAATYRETFDKHIEYDTSRLAVARMDVQDQLYNESRGRAFYDRVLAEVSALPSVERAAIADGVPGAASSGWLPGLTTITAESEGVHVGSAGIRRVSGHYSSVSPDLFDTIGLRISRGRPLRPSDRDGGPPVAVVTETVAAQLWPGDDPIGKRIVLPRSAPVAIVGIAADPARSVDASARNSPGSYVFVPFDQRYQSNAVVIVRAAAPAAAVGPIRLAIRDVDDQVIIQDSGTLDETMLAWAGPLRAAASLMGALGVLALGIAAGGVYGVMSFLVTARMREFGVRLALGASPGRLKTMVLDQALSMLLVGLLPGVLIASLGANVAWTWLPSLAPGTIGPWIVVPIAILALGLLAAFVPARRAARVDPNVALREL
jgi:predicted permease